MAWQIRALVLLNASTEEVHADTNLFRSRSEVEGKDLTGDRLLRESVIRMDPAQAILLEEDAGTIVPSLEIGATAEVNHHGFTENRLPLLILELLEILGAELNGEVPAAESATMTAVLLPVHARHQDGK